MPSSLSDESASCHCGHCTFLASWTFHPSASLSFRAGVRPWSCHHTDLNFSDPCSSPLPCTLVHFTRSLYCRHTYLLVQTFPLLCWFCSVEGRLPAVLTPVLTSALFTMHLASSHPCPVVCTTWAEGSSQQCFSGCPQVLSLMFFSPLALDEAQTQGLPFPLVHLCLGNQNFLKPNITEGGV